MPGHARRRSLAGLGYIGLQAAVAFARGRIDDGRACLDRSVTSAGTPVWRR